MGLQRRAVFRSLTCKCELEGARRSKDASVESQRALQSFLTSVFITIKHWTEFQLFWEHCLFARGSVPQRSNKAQFSDTWANFEHSLSNNPKCRVHPGTPLGCQQALESADEPREEGQSIEPMLRSSSCKPSFWNGTWKWQDMDTFKFSSLHVTADPWEILRL